MKKIWSEFRETFVTIGCFASILVFFILTPWGI